MDIVVIGSIVILKGQFSTQEVDFDRLILNPHV